MNKFFYLIFALVLIGCEKDDPSVKKIESDISVFSTESLISWNDPLDLMQRLKSAISYNFANTPQSEIEQQQIFNLDSTRVTTSIKFKTAFENLYTDPNISNNSLSIDLARKETTLLSANGPGNTYELISSILAPGFDPIEVPDCGHDDFGDHIDEVFDNELNKNVFRFFIHTNADNDRCINFDRQRNEIKAYDKSPDNLLGIENEKVVYNWKFKLAAGFQSSPNFTHLHQLKSVGGSLESMPMYTLTTRKGNPDNLELRYAETDSQVTLKQTALSPLIGEWLEVTEVITYGISGSYEIVIKRMEDETVLFEYSNSSIVNWRTGAAFVRPKWGIYRSLLNAQDLRDEEVLFADFSVTELE
jgi:hypothetical protein